MKIITELLELLNKSGDKMNTIEIILIGGVFIILWKLPELIKAIKGEKEKE